MELVMRVKDINTRSLQTGDKQTWLKLETTNPDDVSKLSSLMMATFVKVTMKVEE